MPVTQRVSKMGSKERTEMFKEMQEREKSVQSREMKEADTKPYPEMGPSPCACKAHRLF